MKSVLPVKMLAALALVLLVSSATEGRILSKCELKAQLEAAQIQVTEAMGGKMTVDDLIARLVCKANASGFNTSFVKAIGAKPKMIKPFDTLSFGHEKQRRMYGVFQLSDQLACDSGIMPSLNVCNMSCSALIDDDITDDIACLKTVIGSMLNTILEKECDTVVPSPYFDECLSMKVSKFPFEPQFEFKSKFPLDPKFDFASKFPLKAKFAKRSFDFHCKCKLEFNF